MLSKFRSYRPGHGTVVAYIALFIALGGTSYAVATGSIESREIKNNTVRSKDIRNNDIRGKDVRTGTLRSSDVADSSLLARDFAAGQLPAGPRGPAGQNGFGVLTYRQNAVAVANGESTALAVECPRGTSATGGDAFALDSGNNDVTNQVLITEGFNFTTPIGWFGQVTNTTGGEIQVFVEAACANADIVTIASKKRRLRR